MAGKKQQAPKPIEEDEEVEGEGWDNVAEVDADAHDQASARMRDWRDVEKYREMRELRRLVGDDFDFTDVLGEIPVRSPGQPRRLEARGGKPPGKPAAAVAPKGQPPPADSVKGQPPSAAAKPGAPAAKGKPRAVPPPAPASKAPVAPKKAPPAKPAPKARPAAKPAAKPKAKPAKAKKK